ncbi:MAG: FtsX-like permease family protein [Pseudomonadota bacterium]
MTRLLAFALRLLVRDLRAGHLTVLLLGLVVAVGALTAVGLFTDRIARGVERQSASVLAADLSVRSAHPPRPEIVQLAAATNTQTVQTVGFPTVVSWAQGDDLRRELVSLKAAEDGYPLRGDVLITDSIGEEGRVAEGLPAPGEVWVDTNLLLRLGGEVGTQLKVGTASFRVGRVLVSRPDQAFAFAEIAPSLLMRLDDLASTGLLRPGSRVVYRQLFAGDASSIGALEIALDSTLAPSETLTDPASLQGPIRDALDNLRRFLGLAAMSAVILAAAAVAIAASRFMRRHLDTAALMKVLGRRQGEVAFVFAVELGAVAVGGAVLGMLLGLLVQTGLTGIAARLIDVTLPPAAPWPLGVGLVTAVLVTGGFALPQLLALQRTPALRVLRADLPAPGAGQLVSYLSALVALGGLLWLIVDDPHLVFWLLGGLGAAALLMLLLAYAVVRLVGMTRGGVGVAWRYGLANLARRGWDSATQVVAFGLGLAVMLLLALLRGDLLEAWQRSLPPDAPNYFLLNIQPDEREGVRALFEDAGVETAAYAPLSRGRLVSINGIAVDEVAFPRDEGGVFASREANISWAADLPPANRVLRGRWWEDGGAVSEVSVEEETFATLGLSLGDRLIFSAAGEEFEASVTSVREVDWDSFEPNFFLVFSPGALGDFPASYLTSAHVDDDQRGALVALGQRYPTVTVYDVNALLTQVRSTVSRAVAAVQYVFALSLVAAVLVLLAAVESTREPRMVEAATLRALGASRRQVLAGIAAEYSAIGALAGLGGAIGAGVTGYFLAREAFSFDYVPAPSLLLLGVVLGLLLVGLAGVASAGRSASVPPVRVLAG